MTHEQLTSLTDEQLAALRGRANTVFVVVMSAVAAGLVASLWLGWRATVAVAILGVPALVLASAGLSAVLDEVERRALEYLS